MSNVILHTPHDKFFKNSLSDISVAEDFLKVHLSPAITQRISWDTLGLTNRSFTDEKLNDLHSDVLYTCQLDNKDAYIYLLVEQQTNPSPLLPFRFLQYNAVENEHSPKEATDTLKAIVPNKEEEIMTALQQLIQEGRQQEKIHIARNMMSKLHLDIKVIREATGLSEEEIIKLQQIEEHPEEVKGLLETYHITSGIHYILAVENEHSPKEVLDALKAIVPNKEEEIMTALQQLKQEGRQQGKIHIARNMMSKLHLDIKVIREATGLSEEEIIKLQQEAKS